MKRNHLFAISILPFLPLCILFAQSGFQSKSQPKSESKSQSKSQSQPEQQRSIIHPGQISQLFLVARTDSVLQLPDQYIVPGSERIVVDSVRSIPPNGYYTLDDRSGKIVLLPAWHRLLNDTLAHVVRVVYRALPLNFQREYFLHQIVQKKEPSGAQRSLLVSPSSIWNEDVFGGGLQKSGSLVRGFTVSSNKDLSLTSGFRMQLAGKLSSDIDIVAALTDENTPLQPEGTTQTLREVDKVFIEIKHPVYSATLGDFTLTVGPEAGGEFGQVSRKLLGGTGSATFSRLGSADIGGSVTMTGATAKGKFTTNQFQGSDGVQGPYRLTGKNGEQQLIVIAGSEHVYIDGNAMIRGETNDYTIDYTNGEVTFASRRLITSASRITVDFEYSDQQYTRNLVSGLVSTESFGKKLKLNVSFLQEADDPDAPIDVTLTDSLKTILRESGSDPYKASVSGVTASGADTATGYGLGQYTKRDTTIAGKKYAVYVYAPGDSTALFSVSFSYISTMPSDSAGYVRMSAGYYKFAGVGEGNYLPRQFLPMPQLHQLFDVNASAQIVKDLDVSGEYAASKLDYNRFSTLDPMESGAAMRFALRYNPKNMMIGGKNIGDLSLSFTERSVDKNFSSADRMNEVEYDRKWNITSSDSANEEMREFSMSYSPVKAYRAGFTYGSLDRTGVERSVRQAATLAVQDSSLPVVQYRIENIESSSKTASTQSTWLRQEGSVEYERFGVRPGIGFEAERKKNLPGGSDSLMEGSFSFTEISPKIAFPRIGKMSVSAEYKIRSEDSTDGGSMNHAFTSLTQLYTWNLQEWNSLSSGLTLSLHRTDFTDEFKQRGNVDHDVILVRSQSRYTPFQRGLETDWYYEFSNQRTARLERVFVRVAKGTGSYAYLGDLNGNGLAEEDEFQKVLYDGDYAATYVESDTLRPVSSLKASTRWRIVPSRMMGKPTTMFEKIVQAITTETYLRVDEKNSTPDTKQIYLLNFSRFLDPSFTIAGSNQILQDVFIFEGKKDLSFRFRLNMQNGLTQYVSAVEQSALTERSVRIQAQLIPEIGNQTDFINKTDKLTASSFSSNERDLLSNGIQSDFSYRPERNIEIGFVLSGSEITDRLRNRNRIADLDAQEIRIVLSLPTTGQIKFDAQRQEASLTNVPKDSLSLLPFEFTEGRVVGRTYLWTVAFDYHIAANFQLSVNYDGRKEGDHAIVHTFRAEARAFF
jgi:hypothetical protein